MVYGEVYYAFGTPSESGPWRNLIWRSLDEGFQKILQFQNALNPWHAVKPAYAYACSSFAVNINILSTIFPVIINNRYLEEHWQCLTYIYMRTAA